MFDPYPLLRSCLFQLDAEQAHEYTLRLLRCAPQLLPVLQHTAPVTLMGLTFPNRLGLAAGLDKNALALPAWQRLGFGHVEIGAVTPRPQAGNPKPRLFRFPQQQALINRMGFNNDGMETVAARLSQLRTRRALIGVNLGKNKDTPNERAVEDYLSGMKTFYPHADYLTINISSPNTANLRALQEHDALEALLKRLAQSRDELSVAQQLRRPLVLKVAPDVNDAQIEAIADALLRHGIDGLIATNTTLDHSAIAPEADQQGGLSGAPLRARSTEILARFARLLAGNVCLIASGGVMSAADYQSKRDAGADLVQLYSGFIYHGPALIQQCFQNMR